jgi:hypothetical protein
MYLPFNIIGLLILRKIPEISDKPLEILKWMLMSWIILIPLSLVAISQFYPFPEIWSDLFPILDAWITVSVMILTMLILIVIISGLVFRKNGNITRMLLALICALPLIWQIDATFLARLYGAGLGGYSFWIPVVRVFFSWIF